MHRKCNVWHASFENIWKNPRYNYHLVYLNTGARAIGKSFEDKYFNFICRKNVLYATFLRCGGIADNADATFVLDKY